MSLPRELLDELLSGYMDGELSSDERARVDQMLAADPGVRESLRLLQEQSQTVRRSLRSSPPLDSGFAERVLAAAFAEADYQSLAESHPLQKAAAAQPVAQRYVARQTDVLGRRHFVGGLAIAAGLAMAAIFYFDRDADRPLAKVDGQSKAANAQLEAAGGNTLPAQESASDIVALLPDAVDDQLPEAEDLLPDTGGNSAVAGPVAPTRTPVAPTRAVAPDERIARADRSPAGRSPADRSPADLAAETPRMIEPAAVSEPRAELSSSDQIALRAVLVYEVHLTPLGRERNVINRAFREAQIRTADQREIDETLVGYLRSGGMIGGTADEGVDEDIAAEDSTVNVMFLEGSGRRLEKLMMTLLAATDEVHSVGFSLAMDPPVMAAIDSLQKVDPTEIRGEAADAVAQTLAPAGVSESVRGFTAGTRRFAPLRRDTFASLSAYGGSTAEEQPDITAMTFLIIRSPRPVASR